MATSLGLFQFFDRGSRLGVTASYVALNRNGHVRAVTPNPVVLYHIAAPDQNVAVLNVSYGTPLIGGSWLELTAQGTDEAIQLRRGDQNQWSASAAWRYTF